MMTMQTHEGMDVILDHFSNPRNYGGFENPDIDVEGSNPGCGDVIRMQAEVDGEGVIHAIGFTGNGCTVSIAATSLLTTLLEGLTIEEAVRVPDTQILDALQASLSPRRYECALLGYRLLRKGLVEYYHLQRLRSGNSAS
jgi:nitrogen fixation NifU-like protein